MINQVSSIHAMRADYMIPFYASPVSILRDPHIYTLGMSAAKVKGSLVRDLSNTIGNRNRIDTASTKGYSQIAKKLNIRDSSTVSQIDQLSNSKLHDSCSSTCPRKK